MNCSSSLNVFSPCTDSGLHRLYGRSQYCRPNARKLVVAAFHIAHRKGNIPSLRKFGNGYGRWASLFASLRGTRPRFGSQAMAQTVEIEEDEVEEEIEEEEEGGLPSMDDIREVARGQGMKLEVRSLGPWFQINLTSENGEVEYGAADAFETLWTDGKILHLEAIRLTRAAPKTGKVALGPGFLVGAAAIRYGLDKNCFKAELLAINDDEETHARLVKYYSRMGFKAMYELKSETISDIVERAVWGGPGTRMDANCVQLLRKWAKFLKPGRDVRRDES